VLNNRGTKGNVHL